MNLKLAIALLIPALLSAFTNSRSKTATKVAHSSGVHKTVHSGALLTTRKTSTPGHTSAKSVRGKRGRYASSKRRVARASYQTHPTPERYKEIQQALVDKGYYKGEVNGQWGEDSADALKRFQTDQKLVNDGKISSLSLIQLGLGPKHDGSSAIPIAPNGSAPVSIPAVTEAPPDSPVSQ